MVVLFGSVRAAVIAAIASSSCVCSSLRSGPCCYMAYFTPEAGALPRFMPVALHCAGYHQCRGVC